MVVIKELELKQFLKLFWDRKVLILLITVIFAVMGWMKIKWFTTPVYEASGKLICARSEESIIEGNTVTSTELTMPSSLAETYAELIKSDLIVNKVINNLGLNISTSQLSHTVELTPLTKVYYIVSVRNTDRLQSAQIANEFIKVFSEEVKNFYEIDNIHLVDEAKVPNTAINMNVVKSIKIFAGIGFVVALGVVMIMFIFNNTVTNSEQIKRYTKLPTLASIPRYSGNEDLITLKDSKSPYAESIKILRTNLQYMYDKGALQTVAITSSLPGEGKSWLSANLAVAFANAGKRTLIIDADMRRGRQHRLFNIRKTPGLSEYLRVNKENTDILNVKRKRVSKRGLARLLGKINEHIKIDKIGFIADIIYKDDYIAMTIEDASKRKALKKEKETQEAKIVVEPEKKTRARKTAAKKVEEEKEAKTTTKKTAAKKATATKKVEEEKEAKTTAKKTAAKKATATKKVEEEKEVKKKITTKTAKKVEEKSAEMILKEETVKKQEEKKVPEVNIANFVRKTAVDNLYVLPAGSETLESSELLSTEKLEEALAKLKEYFDMIIIDTPPVSVVADGFIISRMVDTNMIVLKHGNTEINELNKIKNNIQEIGGEVIGTVINKIPDANRKYYNTYYNKKAR